MTLVVGLTGGIGSGKSTAERFFVALGITCVDADREARNVVAAGEPALQQVIEHFSPMIPANESLLTAEGELNRPLLRRLVFESAEHKQWLEQLLHPLIRKRIQQKLSKATGVYAMLVSPLLFETGQDSMTDLVVVINVSVETQLARATSRDGCSEEQVRRIIDTQIDHQARIARADYVIENEAGEDVLKQQVERVHRQLCQRFAI